jgi:uncharacterized repeat protein (TIGR01451 family)
MNQGSNNTVESATLPDAKVEGNEEAAGGLLTPLPQGIMAVPYVYTNTTPVAIPDSGCGSGIYVTSTISIPDNFLIGDLNVGLWVPHTWRSDLEIRLRAPDGTTLIQLVQDADGSADNINALIDDASPNAPDAVNHPAPPPYYTAWWRTVGNLSDLNGATAQGTWTIEACDDAGGDTGTLTTWTLFFESGLVLIPLEQGGQSCKGSDVIYDFSIINATAVTQSFDIAYTSIWPANGPTVTPVLSAGQTWDFQVTHHIPWSANSGDSDALQVIASGGGDTASVTATTSAAVVQGWQDYANTPAGRGTRAPSVVYWDGKLYKIGGYGGTGAAQPWLDIYDITTNTWTQGADMPGARYWMDCEAIDLTGTEPKIYCAGGYLSSAQSTLYIYDINTNTWGTGTSLPAARYHYASVSLNGLYYVIGGYTTTYQATMEVYDPATNTWNSTLAPMSTTRRYHSAGVIGGMIYVAGGYNGTYLATAEMYNPGSNTWTPIASMPSPWLNAADGVKHDRFLVLAGGASSSTASASNGALMYDAVTNTWEQLPVMNHMLYSSEGDSDGTNFWLASGRLYEGGSFSYSTYTTLMVQCETTCTPVSGADFTVDPAVPWAGWPAILSASVTAGSPSVSFDWDLGDLQTAQGQVIEHTYALTGTYTVVLTATNCDGANTSIATHDVNVILPPTIHVEPTSLAAAQFPDTFTTQNLEICNIGDYPLDWEITEISPTLGVNDIGDAWEIMAPLPEGRVFNAVVADGQYVYVIGGTSDPGGVTPTNTVFRYDTASNTWGTMTPAPTTLSSIDGITINGKIFIPGDGVDATTYVYEISSDNWSSIPTNNGYPPTEQYQVVAIGTDLYVLGGITGGASTTSVWVLDTMSGTWTPGIAMQNSRTSFSAAAIDGNIYVAGGVAYPGFIPDMTAEMFDGSSWSYIASLPDGGGAYTRWSYNADGWGADGLWLGAGRRDAGWTILNHAGYYDPQTNIWTDSPTIPILNQGRVYVEGDVAQDGYFYVIGGRDSSGTIIYNTNERLMVGYPIAMDVPWLSEDPITGTLPSGSCSLVDVNFDSTAMTPGDYFADLDIASNDPATPNIIVPVTLTVLVPNQVTFEYNDVEDVVAVGEDVYLAGSFNGWTPGDILLNPNPDYSVFSVTLTLETGEYWYKYIVASGGDQWDWLNTSDRYVNVDGDITLNDYRLVYVGYAHLPGPESMTVVFGDPTEPITGEVWIQNVTNPAGEGRAVIAQLGYGTDLNPTNWDWFDIEYSADFYNNDLYTGIFTPTATGVYSYAVRFDGNWGIGNPNVGWTYGDTDGVYPGEPFELANTGILTVGAPQVVLTKTVGTEEGVCASTDSIDILAGSEVFYCYTVENTGDITLTYHTLADNALGVLLYDVPYDLSPGDSYSYIHAAVITETVVNTGTWYAYLTQQGYYVSAVDDATVTILPEADLMITKVDNPDPVNVGELITYTIQVANDGLDDAVDVIVTDMLPAEVTFVAASHGCTEVGGVVTCEVGNLANGDSVEITITVTAPLVEGEVTNEAEVSSATYDPVLENNQATATTTVVVPEPPYVMIYLPYISKE